MTPDLDGELLRAAARYIWWEPPGEAIRRPARVIAQVMDLGDFEDVQRLVDLAGPDRIRATVLDAEPGWFSERSWAYWCHRLGVTEPGAPLPPLPRRTFD
jgi:hypothetical protein